MELARKRYQRGSVRLKGKVYWGYYRDGGGAVSEIEFREHNTLRVMSLSDGRWRVFYADNACGCCGEGRSLPEALNDLARDIKSFLRPFGAPEHGSGKLFSVTAQQLEEAKKEAGK